MDFSWIIWFLVVVVVLCVAFAILKYLIMPVVPAAMQAFVWAIIGVCLLIMLLYFVGSHFGGHSMQLEPR